MERTVFIGGAPEAKKLMALKREAKLDQVPVVAIAGRSNVGKSTLLNALFGISVARVSSTPGRTQAINLFRYKKILLADLPGYGYAKASKEKRQAWGREIPCWLEQDPAICAVLLLVDGRHGLTELDEQFLQYLRTRSVAHLLIFNKMDHFKSANQRRGGEAQILSQCSRLQIPPEGIVFVSGKKKQGLGVILSHLESLSKSAKNL